MDITARVLFEVGQQRREVVARLGQRIVKRRVVQQLADGSFARADPAQQVVDLADRVGELLHEPGTGQVSRDAVHAAHDAVHTRGVLAEHHGESRKVIHSGFQIVLLGIDDTGHVARDGIQVSQRPGDALRVGFHQVIEGRQRTREVARHLRDLLFEEIQFRPGHVHQVAVTARTQRIALFEIRVRRSVGDLDGLGAHQSVAENLGLGVGRNVVLTFDGQLQHDVVAALGIERNPRHRADLHAFHHNRRSRLHAVDLVIGGVIHRIAAEDVESFQKPDSGPRGDEHHHGEDSDFNFSFHI